MDLAKAEALYEASVEVGKQIEALTRLHDASHALISKIHDDALANQSGLRLVGDVS